MSASLGFGFYTLHSKFGEFGAQAVHIESQFAGFQPGSGALFAGSALAAEAGHFGGGFARHHAHAVLICHDNVAGADEGAGTDHFHVDASRGGLDGALSRDGFRPNREVHGGEFGGVAHTGVDHQADDAVGAAGFGQQVTEHTVVRCGGDRHHEDVAGDDDFHGGVDHQVVARRAEHGDGASRQAGGGVNRPHIG